MDLNELDLRGKSEEGVECRIYRTDAEPTDIYIRVKGVHTAEFRASVARYNNKSKARRGDAVDPIESMANILASVTIGWRGIEANGKALPFSRQEAIRVYTDWPIIRNQLWEFVVADENFLPDSSSTSSSSPSKSSSSPKD